ncbi:Coniferyl aldehyde dehydrogenase [Methyloligella halotolerans]|uniref:Aldehyde dehydrogenase n=1 Tax=Methyloligella halotolerans TaxID=1177755 RepID=A0A1E2S0F1_9HYPH|nr:coniferyl aldehyde dehydrogenase [Methyloligella halotolerans]ODA67983.1 Coniferyl aldehyde dehydrogenase [Methyloligella halotolerans]
MNTTQETGTDTPETDAAVAMRATLAKQRAAFLREGPPPLQQRRRDLTKLKEAILSRQDAFVASLDADFGHRARQESQMLDLGSGVGAINYLHANLRRFMRPERRRVAAVFKPGSAEVLYQPLGVIGVVAPWNLPLSLSLTPLATALAAGNRVMLKPSELTPATAELVTAMIDEIFDEEQVAVVNGDAEVGQAFASLAFDHVFFTGSIPVGKAIMRAASENLVPTTLELGGKSPVIVADDFPLETAARRVAYGKCANGGQICTSPDYLLLPKAKVGAFAASFRQQIETLYPDVPENPDFTAIVNDRHFQRLSRLVEDARSKGANVVEMGGADSGRSHPRTFPPVMLLGVTEDMAVMQEEIFGPILPVVVYDRIEDAVAYVNARPRPLALYFFGNDPEEQRLVLDRTTSGGVLINDTILHYAQDDLPFGGIGPSGMGSYHGIEGFRTMSHAKSVFRQARFNLVDLIRPPFGGVFDFLMKFMLR